jgi:hypothetical protein
MKLYAAKFEFIPRCKQRGIQTYIFFNTKPPPCPPFGKIGGLGEGKDDVSIEVITYSISQIDSITFS